MKKSYILDGYDKLIRQLITQNVTNTELINEELEMYADNSYRIYKIFTSQTPEPRVIKIEKPIHSQHPYGKLRDLKSIFNLPELSIYIQDISKYITLNNEMFYMAKSSSSKDCFYLYEKCSIMELPSQEKIFLLYKIRSKELNEHIKERLRVKVFKSSNEDEIFSLMNKIQATLQHYLAQLSKYIELSTEEITYTYTDQYNKIDCFKIVHYNLEKLQYHIECYFASYIDKNLPMPSISVDKKLLLLQPKLDFILSHLLASDVSVELLSLYSVPINLLKNNSIKNKISYHQFEYIQKFVHHLYNKFKSKNAEISNDQLIIWLLDMNYNSIQYFNLKTDLILFAMKELESDAQVLEYLYSKLKKYNQHRTDISISLCNKLPDIKVQISSWIEEEIEFIQRKRQLDNRHIGTLQRLNSSNKILVNLSVAQLSYFIFILVQTGIIKHQNLKELFRIFSDNFRTKQADSISVDSLSSKYYNVENSTKQTIKEKIIQLLNFTKS